MSVLVWVLIGIAVWHFTVLLPDRFHGGISPDRFVGREKGLARGERHLRRHRPGGRGHRRAGSAAVTLDQLREWLTVHEVAKLKWPERLEIIDELPVTPTRKVKKAELAARLGRKSE